jgi:hypothetical protein
VRPRAQRIVVRVVSGASTKETEGSFERLHLSNDVEKGTRYTVRLPPLSVAGVRMTLPLFLALFAVAVAQPLLL